MQSANVATAKQATLETTTIFALDSGASNEGTTPSGGGSTPTCGAAISTRAMTLAKNAMGGVIVVLGSHLEVASSREVEDELARGGGP